MSGIWLCEELELDWMENRHERAVQWEVRGVASEEAAHEWCEKGEAKTREDCWALPAGVTWSRRIREMEIVTS